jgi:hypothetical protein
MERDAYSIRRANVVSDCLCPHSVARSARRDCVFRHLRSQHRRCGQSPINLGRKLEVDHPKLAYIDSDYPGNLKCDRPSAKATH